MEGLCRGHDEPRSRRRPLAAKPTQPSTEFQNMLQLAFIAELALDWGQRTAHYWFRVQQQRWRPLPAPKKTQTTPTACFGRASEAWLSLDDVQLERLRLLQGLRLLQAAADCLQCQIAWLSDAHPCSGWFLRFKPAGREKWRNKSTLSNPGLVNSWHSAATWAASLSWVR